MPKARLAETTDLASLLELYRISEVSAIARPPSRAEQVWQEMLAQPGLAVLVSGEGDRIAATCVLITAPNLLREGRRHGFLENVVAHPELRGRGHGRAVVSAALELAWSWECHHVLLQSGRADPSVHRFYEGLGFEAGWRTAYVVHRPRAPLTSVGEADAIGACDNILP